MLWLYVFDPPYMRRETQRIDYWGIGLLALWVGALQLVLDQGQQRDWFASPLITTLVVAVWPRPGGVPGPRWLAKSRSIDLRVFKIRTYAIGVFLMTRSASCSTAAWCCCRSCCRRCSATRRSRPASPWPRAASARSSACR